MNIWVDKPNDSTINTCVERNSPDVMCIFRNGSHANYLEHAGAGARIVLCVRDPKDVLVSQYFSWKGTHIRNTERIKGFRAQLESVGLSEGLMLLIEHDQVPFCSSIRKWPGPDQDKAIHLLRFEDLIQSFYTAMQRAADHLSLKVELGTDLEDKYSFKTITKRDSGVERRTSHYRKGVAGDWVNYFNEEITEAFDDRFGSVCDQLGYERAGRARDRIESEAR